MKGKKENPLQSVVQPGVLKWVGWIAAGIVALFLFSNLFDGSLRGSRTTVSEDSSVVDTPTTTKTVTVTTPVVKSGAQNQNAITAEELEPDATFVKGQAYVDMYKYVEQRHDIPKLRKEFSANGYIVFKPDIPEQTLADAAAFTKTVYDRCIANRKPEDDACRNFHQERYEDVPAVRDLATNYHIRAVLAVLHQHDPYPFQTLNYPLTSLARTHSDYIHFAANPAPLMSAAWVALMDVNPEAGPVFYHEGSHKLPFYNLQDFGLDNRQSHPLNYAKYQDVMTEAMRMFGNRKEAVIPRGHCLIWSANLVHGGPPATNQALLRLSQVTHYFFHNSYYNWAPVASDVRKGVIEYYDPEKIRTKWDNSIAPEKRRAISKFQAGDCKMKVEGVHSPCDMQSRMPQVMSKLMSHVSEKGNDVIM